MKITIIAALLPLVVACSSGFGSKLASDKLDVYYSDASLQSYADSLGSYWTKNGLTGSRKQSIQLEYSKKGYAVKIIRSQEFEKQDLSVEEIALLNELTVALSNEVFNKKAVNIVICDDEFKPIYTIEP